jgi:hypothetical protein
MAAPPVATKGFSAVICKLVVTNERAARAHVNHVKDRLLIIDTGRNERAATGEPQEPTGSSSLLERTVRTSARPDADLRHPKGCFRSMVEFVKAFDNS